MRRFKYAVLLLAFALLGFVSFGYSQDTPNPSDVASDSSALLEILVGILIVSVILVGVVFFGFWKNPLNKSIQELTRKLNLNQLNQITNELETLNKRIRELMLHLDSSQADETALRIEQELKSIRNGIYRNTKGLEGTASEQSSILAQQRNLQAKFGQLEKQLKTLEAWRKVITCQQEAESIVKETQKRVEKLAEDYREGEPIDFTTLENLSAVQKLNVIASDIHQWKTELEKFSQQEANLAQFLAAAETFLKEKLKEDRGSPPTPTPLDLETDISTETALDRIRQKCDAYVDQFESTLSAYETKREVDVEAYDQFIFDFIKDRLFNSLTSYFQSNQLPEQVNKLLQYVDLEVIPIALGKTVADARSQEIQASRRTDGESNTIVEVISPGLRRQSDGVIVQKPVVIRGE